MATIEQLASVVRSKNAEPFFTTIDIYFSDDDSYKRVKDSGVITKERVAEAYNIPEEAVYGIFFVDVIIIFGLVTYGGRDRRSLA